MACAWRPQRGRSMDVDLLEGEPEGEAWYSNKQWLGAGVACAFAAIAVTISLFHCRHHLYHYNEPIVQRYTIRILLMVPVYAMDSALSLLTPHNIGSFILVTLRDCYEAYTLYNCECPRAFDPALPAANRRIAR